MPLFFRKVKSPSNPTYFLPCGAFGRGGLLAGVRWLGAPHPSMLPLPLRVQSHSLPLLGSGRRSPVAGFQFSLFPSLQSGFHLEAQGFPPEVLLFIWNSLSLTFHKTFLGGRKVLSHLRVNDMDKFLPVCQSLTAQALGSVEAFGFWNHHLLGYTWTGL